MDRHLGMRLLLTAGITAVAVALWLALTGQSVSALRLWWPLPVSLFIFVYICVDFAGKFRSPREEYDRTLEDDWDR